LGVVWVSSGSLAFITYRIEFENQSILMDLFLFSYFFQRVKREKQMTSQCIPPWWQRRFNASNIFFLNRLKSTSKQEGNLLDIHCIKFL
jgi:hypothetical protein